MRPISSYVNSYDFEFSNWYDIIFGERYTSFLIMKTDVIFIALFKVINGFIIFARMKCWNNEKELNF